MRNRKYIMVWGCLGLTLFFLMAVGAVRPLILAERSDSSLEGHLFDPPPYQERLNLPSVIVDNTWLQAHLTDARLVIVDARTPEAYARGHIPGAVNITSNDLADKNPEMDTEMARVSEVQQMLGNAGIDNQKTIVIYDDSDYRPAARIFWILEVHGHSGAAVLNGGYEGWKNETKLISTAAPHVVKTRFIANLEQKYFVTKLDVYKAIGRADTVLLDSRASELYTGKVPKFGRRGHIQSAINMDVLQNLETKSGQGCNIHLSEELTVLYREKLANKTRIIAYCNTGGHAAVSYLLLRDLGYSVAVYDGSWKEWSADLSMPIESEYDEAGNKIKRPDGEEAHRYSTGVVANLLRRQSQASIQQVNRVVLD